MKVLLVDDKKENLLALSSLLAAPDLEILSATSGNDALALLLDHDFALAMLDVQMPGMNGFELAKLMRSAERSRHIPIIFVTASQITESEVFEGYGNGAVDYLVKPLSARIVRSKVRVFIELAQKTRALEEKVLEGERLRDAAEAANRAKSRFLANMSHEIRTPLGAVLGYADLLRESCDLPDEREVCLAAIERNGQLLLKLVDDVLDLAKIEAERLEIEPAQVSLAELLADLKATHQHKADAKGIGLGFVTQGRLPRTVTTDSLRLKQALNNVIGNAVKFTSQGGVVVNVSCQVLANGRVQLCFTVTDTGLGLSALESCRLFQPFAQADGSTKRRFGGTGLGLVIAKQLAQLLGGDLTLAASRKGEGSTFVATVDAGEGIESSMVDGASLLANKPRLARAESRLPRLDGLRVLVADDMPDNRKLISRALGLAGAVVDLAADGAEAVRMASAQAYDAILMDIQMPDMDGREATTALRRKGYDRPIIALTAHAMKEEVAKCLAAGCDRHLSKPIDLRLLVEAIHELRESPARADSSV